MDISTQCLSVFKSFVNDIIKVFPEYKIKLEDVYGTLLKMDECVLEEEELLQEFLERVNKLNKKKLENLKTVCTIHHIDEAKVDSAYLDDFKARDKYVDIYHVPSKKTEALLNNLTNKPKIQIPFWVDSQKFYEIKGIKSFPKNYQKYS